VESAARVRHLPAGPPRDSEARLIKDAFGWQIVFRTETKATPVMDVHPGPAVGIDRVITVALALSDETTREYGPWLSAGEGEHLRRLEKKSARQRAARPPGQPTSHRLRRTYDQMARLRATAKRRAVDWQHQITTELAATFSVIVVEDLKIINMVRSAKGTIEHPGRNVRQKAGLNRAITGQAWGRTVTLLEYKTRDRGGQVLKVPAPGTSQTCHRCGHRDPAARNGTRFSCTDLACGWTGHADTNAAINIRNASGCGSAFSMQFLDDRLYIVTTDGSLACIDASEAAITAARAGTVPQRVDVKAAAPNPACPATGPTASRSRRPGRRPRSAPTPRTRARSACAPPW
jgi:putative transposase